MRVFLINKKGGGCEDPLGARTDAQTPPAQTPPFGDRGVSHDGNWVCGDVQGPGPARVQRPATPKCPSTTQIPACQRQAPKPLSTGRDPRSEGAPDSHVGVKRP